VIGEVGTAIAEKRSKRKEKIRQESTICLQTPAECAVFAERKFAIPGELIYISKESFLKSAAGKRGRTDRF
jgi:hypothetical protein